MVRDPIRQKKWPDILCPAMLGFECARAYGVGGPGVTGVPFR